MDHTTLTERRRLVTGRILKVCTTTQKKHLRGSAGRAAPLQCMKRSSEALTHSESMHNNTDMCNSSSAQLFLLDAKLRQDSSARCSSLCPPRFWEITISRNHLFDKSPFQEIAMSRNHKFEKSPSWEITSLKNTLLRDQHFEKSPFWEITVLRNRKFEKTLLKKKTHFWEFNILKSHKFE